MMPNPTGVNPDAFINGSRTSTGTVVTLGANKYFSVDIQLSGAQSGAGTAAPAVTFNSTSTGGTFSPASGSTVARLELVGLLGITASDSCTVELSGYTGDTGATIDFTAAGTSSVVVNGFTI